MKLELLWLQGLVPRMTLALQTQVLQTQAQLWRCRVEGLKV